MIKYREADDDFEAIIQKYGNMTKEELDKIFKAEVERMKKSKKLKTKSKNE